MLPNEYKTLREAFRASSYIDMDHLKADMVVDAESLDIRIQTEGNHGNKYNRNKRPFLVVFNDEQAMRVPIDRRILKKLKARLEQEERLYKMEVAGYVELKG